MLGYWYPDGRTGMVGTDTIAVVAGAEHPVLAHHFLNYMLDNDNALENFGFVGYQPALQKFTPGEHGRRGVRARATCRSTIVTPSSTTPAASCCS